MIINCFSQPHILEILQPLLKNHQPAIIVLNLVQKFKSLLHFYGSNGEFFYILQISRLKAAVNAKTPSFISRHFPSGSRYKTRAGQRQESLLHVSPEADLHSRRMSALCAESQNLSWHTAGCWKARSRRMEGYSQPISQAVPAGRHLRSPEGSQREVLLQGR